MLLILCSALPVFSENMGHPQLKKNVIVNKCPKLLRIYFLPKLFLCVFQGPLVNTLRCFPLNQIQISSPLSTERWVYHLRYRVQVHARPPLYKGQFKMTHMKNTIY